MMPAHVPYSPRTDKRYFAEVGRDIWGSETPGHSDDDALRAIMAWVSRNERRDPEWGSVYRRFLSDGHFVRHLVCAAHWARNAFPLVTMSHKYAAALLATAVTPELRPHIALPWDVFMIDVPVDLIVGRHADGRAYRVETILVEQLQKPTRDASIVLCLLTDTGNAIWTGVTHDGLAGDLAHLGVDHHGPFSFEFGDQERRICHLAQRLLANVCLAMSDPANLKPLGKGKPHPPAKRKTGQPPLTTFQLGQSVEVDCRQAIRDYIEGLATKPGKALSLQMLVRGHWKRQHHGAGNNRVKVIWVQPYWRGPDTAPILTRPHVMPTEPRSPNAEVSHA